MHVCRYVCIYTYTHGDRTYFDHSAGRRHLHRKSRHKRWTHEMVRTLAILQARGHNSASLYVRRPINCRPVEAATYHDTPRGPQHVLKQETTSDLHQAARIPHSKEFHAFQKETRADTFNLKGSASLLRVQSQSTVDPVRPILYTARATWSFSIGLLHAHQLPQSQLVPKA